jgi:hypothetical protein
VGGGGPGGGGLDGEGHATFLPHSSLLSVSPTSGAAQCKEGGREGGREGWRERGARKEKVELSSKSALPPSPPPSLSPVAAQAIAEGTPRADPSLPRHTPQRRRSSLIRNQQRMAALKDLPMLRDTSAARREALFQQKLQLCAVVFNFDDPQVRPCPPSIPPSLPPSFPPSSIANRGPHSPPLLSSLPPSLPPLQADKKGKDMKSDPPRARRSHPSLPPSFPPSLPPSLLTSSAG